MRTLSIGKTRNNIIILFFTLFSSLGLLGCGLPGQQLAPRIEIQPKMEGVGLPKCVKVVCKDERDSDFVGRRAGFIFGGALETGPDFASRVESALKNGLAKNGLTVNKTPDCQGRSLTVMVMSLEYQDDGDRVSASTRLKALAENGEEKLSREVSGEKTLNVSAPPDESSNEILIGQVIGRAINKIINDRDLLEFFSRDILQSKKLD